MQSLWEEDHPGEVPSTDPGSEWWRDYLDDYGLGTSDPWQTWDPWSPAAAAMSAGDENAPSQLMRSDIPPLPYHAKVEDHDTQIGQRLFGP